MTLPNLSTAQLLVVDLQEKLVPAMHHDEQPRLRKCAANLIHAARTLAPASPTPSSTPKGSVRPSPSSPPSCSPRSA